ncbi:MAG: transposase [Opitutaceae bacterium]|nr:transposase [Opitutaceae bacterium]
MAALFAAHSFLAGLCELKKKLWALLRMKNQSKGACRHHIGELLHLLVQLRQSGFEPARTLAQTIEDWSEEIVCLWRFTRNNGITESFHRKMKLI